MLSVSLSSLALFQCVFAVFVFGIIIQSVHVGENYMCVDYLNFSFQII